MLLFFLLDLYHFGFLWERKQQKKKKKEKKKSNILYLQCLLCDDK